MAPCMPRLKPSRRLVIDVAGIVVLVVVLLVGTVCLEVGPTVLNVGQERGIHLGDLVLFVVIGPVLMVMTWRLMDDLATW